MTPNMQPTSPQEEAREVFDTIVDSRREYTQSYYIADEFVERCEYWMPPDLHREFSWQITTFLTDEYHRGCQVPHLSDTFV